VHDRYHPDLFNPYNEVECGDHYARAMASWGVYLALAGFRYNGPKGWLGFGPRISPENFRAAFTTAEGWITFEQTRNKSEQRDSLEVRWGKLRLTRLSFETEGTPRSDHVTIQGKKIKAKSHPEKRRITIEFEAGVVLQAGERLEITLKT